MIIAVCAPPLVDKSEVSAGLASDHRLKVIRDPAPELCARYGFQTLYDMPADLQRSCREQLMKDHLALLQSSSGLLLEYSAVEWMADWMRWFWGGTPTQSWAKILAQGGEAVRRYDQIYQVENGRSRAYDGYAWLDRENSRQVGSLMRYLHGELGVSDRVKQC